MAAIAGLQVYDENGMLVTEVTDRIQRIIGMVQTNRLDGYVDVDTTGTFFYQIIRISNGNVDSPPKITTTATRLSWTYYYDFRFRSDAIIVYGKY